MGILTGQADGWGGQDVDVFFAEYISPSDDMAQVFGALEEIWAWKEAGKVRYVGATCHNRELALKLIESGRVEILMHRYNMAHRGAEEQVLPAAESAGIPVVSFTNTRWGSLLKGHSDWQGDPPKAADCYRYVLQQQAVKLALTAPGTVRELKENLDVVIHPSEMSPKEVCYWEAYGKLVYGQGTDAFETRWP